MSEIIKRNDVEGQLRVQDVKGLGKGQFLPTRGVIPRLVVSAAKQAEAIINEARQTADQIIAQARELKDHMASQVETERKKGYDQGHQEGLAQVTEQVTSATHYREKMLQDAEPEVVSMVYQIVEKILGDAVKKGAIVDIVRQALQEAIGERVTVRIHPEDLDKVRASETDLKEKLQNIKSLNVVADEQIERGGCAVDTEVGTIDAELSTQLAAIKKSLGLTEQGDDKK